LAEGGAVSPRSGSPLYRSFAKLRKISRTRFVTTASLGAGLALIIAEVSGNSIDTAYVQGRFDSAMISHIHFNDIGPFRCTEVIGLDSDIAIDALAASEGLHDVHTIDNKSLRRLHGRVLEKIAAAAPKVVALD